MGYIEKACCEINNSKVLFNNIEMQIPVLEGSSWLHNIYFSLQIDYLKFFKMDNLSKAGFLASEIIMKKLDINRENISHNISLIGFNSVSSLDDDITYQNTISDKDNFFPSPAVFVYTLANIVLGEIAIRNKIQAETSFFVIKEYDEKIISNYVEDVFNDNESVDIVICCWLNYLQNNCDVKVKFFKKI